MARPRARKCRMSAETARRDLLQRVRVPLGLLVQPAIVVPVPCPALGVVPTGHEAKVLAAHRLAAIERLRRGVVNRQDTVGEFARRAAVVPSGLTQDRRAVGSAQLEPRLMEDVADDSGLT